MANNKLMDLNDHLFAQMERLNDETISPKEMELEIRKAKAVSMVSNQIISNAKLVFDAAKLASKGDLKKEFIPAQLKE